MKIVDLILFSQPAKIAAHDKYQLWAHAGKTSWWRRRTWVVEKEWRARFSWVWCPFAIPLHSQQSHWHTLVQQFIAICFGWHLEHLQCKSNIGMLEIHTWLTFINYFEFTDKCSYHKIIFQRVSLSGASQFCIHCRLSIYGGCLPAGAHILIPCLFP